jgi:hypothetical protein
VGRQGLPTIDPDCQEDVMAEQFRKPFTPEPPERLPRRADFATTADWWEALTGAEEQEYIEREGCLPLGAMRGWRGPQDPRSATSSTASTSSP